MNDAPPRHDIVAYQPAFLSVRSAQRRDGRDLVQAFFAYGGMQNRFGMGCLLARKLVEKGVSAVEVDLGGWDNHAGIFNTLRTGNGRASPTLRGVPACSSRQWIPTSFHLPCRNQPCRRTVGASFGPNPRKPR